MSPETGVGDHLLKPVNLLSRKVRKSGIGNWKIHYLPEKNCGEGISRNPYVEDVVSDPILTQIAQPDGNDLKVEDGKQNFDGP